MMALGHSFEQWRCHPPDGIFDFGVTDQAQSLRLARTRRGDKGHCQEQHEEIAKYSHENTHVAHLSGSIST